MCSLCALCGVHIGIPTPSLCGLWHGHHYIFCSLYLFVFFVILKVVWKLLSESSKQMIEVLLYA